MNTKEIDQFVRGDRASRGIFQGVFSVDTLPDKPPAKQAHDRP
jgi:hypothetical protein